jgi:hypothetical protein
MKRALLIGIDRYAGFNDLTGCANDVEALRPLLSRNEDDTPNFSCQIRTTATGGVGRDRLLADLDVMFGGGADVALLYFAGHGVGSGSDVKLVTGDGTLQTPGIAFSEILSKAVASPVREVIVIVDCCFSGSAGGVPQLGGSTASLRDGISILAASRGDQTAAETAVGRGLFSTFLEGALDGGAADIVGKVTIAGVYSYLDESFGAWDQRPTFKANVDRLHELRRCEPAVPLRELRQINQLFPRSDHEFALDPSYEPDAEPEDLDHQATFQILRRYFAAKLLKPIGAEHMYDAAMKSTACQLTPLGRHYWHMASQDRL